MIDLSKLTRPKLPLTTVGSSWLGALTNMRTDTASRTMSLGGALSSSRLSISAAIRSGAGRFPAGQPASMSLDGWRFHGLTAMVIASWRNPLHKGSI